MDTLQRTGLYLVLVCALSASAQGICHADTVQNVNAAVTITLVDKDAGVVEAEYVLSRAVTTLQFYRSAESMRTSDWTVESPGVQIKNDTVERADGKAFERFKVRVSPESGFNMAMDYEPAARFIDGSLALYTGHFDVAGDQNTTTFHFKSPNTAVYAFGHKVSPDDKWISDHQGTFVYFGQIAPIATQDSTIIVDKDLPHWMQTILEEVTPAAAGFYEHQYGVRLGYTPFLLLSWSGRNDEHSLDLNGDTVRGVIRYRLSGAGWKDDSPKNKQILTRTIAHEIAHFWNESEFHPDQQNGGSWLAEGQSETSALATAAHFGWLDEAAIRQRYSDEISDCIHDPDPSPISTQQAESAVYGCGVTFNLMAAEAIKGTGNKDGFFALWKVIYADARAHGNMYTVADFTAVLDELSHSSSLSEVISGLVKSSSANKQSAILNALTKLGVQYTLDLPQDDDIVQGRKAMQPMMAAIMADDCGGHARFTATHDAYRIEPVPGCHVFLTGYVVTKINGLAIFSQAEKVYESVDKECGVSHKINLTVGDAQHLLVSCPKVLPDVPKAVDIAKLP